MCVVDVFVGRLFVFIVNTSLRFERFKLKELGSYAFYVMGDTPINRVVRTFF